MGLVGRPRQLEQIWGLFFSDTNDNDNLCMYLLLLLHESPQRANNILSFHPSVVSVSFADAFKKDLEYLVEAREEAIAKVIETAGIGP